MRCPHCGQIIRGPRGRPRIAPEVEQRIKAALAQPARPGIRKLAKQFNVGTGTVQRMIRD
jgi:hypothetical protein